MKRTCLSSLLFLWVIWLGTACAATPNITQQAAEPAFLPSENQSALVTPAPTQEPTAQPPLEEFPTAALLARQALAETLGTQPEKVEIRAVESVEWPDSCLGLGGPAEACLQAVLPGYRITLSFEGLDYVYRTDETGTNLRRETDTPFNLPSSVEPRFLASWQNAECTEQALLLPEGLSFGVCGGSQTLLTWEDGTLPAPMADWLTRLGPFQAETPAGIVRFSGAGNESAAPAEQRAIAEWLKMRFLAAQSGRPQADWGLALTYTRQGGFAGFCDTLKVYLDGSVLLSSCKDVDVDFRLTPAQLEALYRWYDEFSKIEYVYTDPAVADAMSITLTVPAQGGQEVTQATLDEILTFCSMLIQQARTP
ncbi:MAG: hypothetical protein DDG60_01855 [Anaerolineae bacterium]|nr:MAG: hypothetical protein DDG60_01855 [Anaerolineae bacterium]